MKATTFKLGVTLWWVLAIAILICGYQIKAHAQQPNGVINAPIYATGYISQVGGTNVTTKIPAQPNHPANQNVYLTGAVTGTWSIQLPNPAFEGQILTFSCGAAVNSITIQSSDGSSVDSNLPPGCVSGSSFATQFDQRSNIWRYVGYNSATSSNGNLPEIDVNSPPSSLGVSGLACDGTDQTSKLNALLSALQTAGTGGELVFHACTYRISSAITLPNDGASTPKQVTFTFKGVGGYSAGQDVRPSSGTILDMRGSDTYGRLRSFGIGLLKMRDLTITNKGNSTGAAFIYVTNTTTDIKRVAFIGAADRIAGATDATGPNEDVIIYGGATTTLGGAPTAPFQGYISIFEDNYADWTRRLVVGQTYFNANSISRNWVNRNAGCGSMSGCAVVDINGDASSTGQYATTNSIKSNAFEISNYAHGIKLQWTLLTQVDGNSCYDATATTLDCVYLGTNASQTVVVANLGPGSLAYLADPTGRMAAGDGIYISPNNAYSTTFPTLSAGLPGYPNLFGPTVLNATGNSNAIQPKTLIGGNSFIDFKTGPSDSSANATMFQFTGLGEIKINPSAAAQGSAAGITCSTSGCASFTNLFKNWVASGTGGAMLQNSGTGGSYFTMRNYAALFTRWDTGAQVAQIGPQFGGAALEGIGLGVSNDVELYRAAAGSLGITGHVGSRGTAPTPSSCGTSPTLTGTDTAFTVTTGSTATTSCTVTFAAAYAATPHCVASPVGAANSGLYLTPGTSTVVLTYSSATSQKFSVQCNGL